MDDPGSCWVLQPGSRTILSRASDNSMPFSYTRLKSDLPFAFPSVLILAQRPTLIRKNRLLFAGERVTWTFVATAVGG